MLPQLVGNVYIGVNMYRNFGWRCNGAPLKLMHWVLPLMSVYSAHALWCV
jgi:hypothetical protein